MSINGSRWARIGSMTWSSPSLAPAVVSGPDRTDGARGAPLTTVGSSMKEVDSGEWVPAVS